MWAMMAAPLIVGLDMRDMTTEEVEILANREVIAVDQDPLGVQGQRVHVDGDHEVWVKPMADGSKAVALFNRADGGGTLAVKAADLGLPDLGGYSLRDLWTHQTTTVADTVSAFVPAHGVAMFRVEPGVPPQAPPSTVLAVEGGQDLVLATPGEIATTFTNHGTLVVREVTMNLSAPAGWTAEALSDRAPVDVDPGQSTGVRWRVVTSSGLDVGEPHELRGEASYRYGPTAHRVESREQALVGPFGCYVPRSALTATASSQFDLNSGPGKAIDGDARTHWRSGKADDQPLPATLTIDLGEKREVNGFTYLPRQDPPDDGNVTGYVLSVSTDGATFTRVAAGTWPDDRKLKVVEWPAVPAIAVRLEVTAGVAGIASAAEVRVATPAR